MIQNYGVNLSEIRYFRVDEHSDSISNASKFDLEFVFKSSNKSSEERLVIPNLTIDQLFAAEFKLTDQLTD